MYHMGATTEELLRMSMFSNEGIKLAPAKECVITDETWKNKIGENRCGVHGMGAEINYPEYLQYYNKMIETYGAENAITQVWPLVAKGLVGDILHAVI